MTPCSAGSFPVSMFAWTGHVTAGQLGRRTACWPWAVRDLRLGICATSCWRNPGTDRKTTRFIPTSKSLLTVWSYSYHTQLSTGADEATQDRDVFNKRGGFDHFAGLVV